MRNVPIPSIFGNHGDGGDNGFNMGGGMVPTPTPTHTCLPGAVTLRLCLGMACLGVSHPWDHSLRALLALSPQHQRSSLAWFAFCCSELLFWSNLAFVYFSAETPVEVALGQMQLLWEVSGFRWEHGEPFTWKVPSLGAGWFPLDSIFPAPNWGLPPTEHKEPSCYLNAMCF